MRQAVDKFPVVGQEKQAFAVLVETAYRHEPLFNTVEKVVDCFALFRRCAANVAARLVEHDGTMLCDVLDHFAVKRDDIVLGINAGARPGDGVAIHGDPPGSDHLLTFAPRRDPSLGKELL